MLTKIWNDCIAAMFRQLGEYLGELRRSSDVAGLERCLDKLLICLRAISVSYWLRFCPERKGQTVLRNKIVDFLCVMEILILAVILVKPWGTRADELICAYLIFQIYLILFNIVFLGKFEKINYPPQSIERVVLLMSLNVLEVTTAFAVLYRDALSLKWSEAISDAIHVLGTVGAPSAAGNWRVNLYVNAQILLDLMILIIFLATFAGKLTILRRAGDTSGVSETR